jgi:hypothetical protein
MNIELIALIVRYVWFLLQTGGPQRELVRVRVRELGGGRHARRAELLNPKH